MRAAVGLMLSHSGEETVMSRPDYEQTALHHSCLLVLLRGVGPSKPRSLQKAFDKVRRVNNIKVNDSNGVTRSIWIRYIHDHPVENNDWGDFQTHRRLLGLITIGKFDNQIELNELCRQHESLKVRYGSTLYETRAIFFGPENRINAQTKKEMTNHVQSNESEFNEIKSESSNEYLNINSSLQKSLEEEYTTPSNFKSQAFFYRENDLCSDLDSRMSDFVNALFWILESKRLERSREKAEKISLLMAPIEKRDFVGLKKESRTNRKRSVGRVMKNLADLSLQAGLIEDALSLYHNSCETLRSINDALWVGATEEGLCAASSVLLYPQLRELGTLHRNASLPEGSSPLRAIPEKWRVSDMTKKVSTAEITHADDTSQHTNLGAKQITASSSCSSVSSILTTNSSASGTPTTSSSTSTISATTYSQQRLGELPCNILKSEEISNYYRNAIINYSQYRHAAIIETEAALKATRICIEQNRPLDVAMFLQNILNININMSEVERVKRFEIITDLYQQIGYQRKAAFFQRLAALKHVQQGNQAPDWNQSYRLMLASFSGYLLSLDPLDVLNNAAGWPSLQIDLLQSLISAARRLGYSALATRHMTFLLQTQWVNMSPTEQSEMAVQLQNLSAQCEGSPVPLVLENGIVIPPANLTDLPYCIEFIVKDLPAHLRPQRIKIAKAETGPFLFTPIHFNSIDRREKQKEKNKIAFSWVQNDLIEVMIRLRNPLPFELPVNDMRLLTNGIVFESMPQTVILQPHVPNYVTLQGTPIEIGELDLLGYSTHALGVKSNCRLKHMGDRGFPPKFIVDVIPALPLISVKTSLPEVATFSNMNSPDIVTSASITLYNGEVATCVVTITNESTLFVEQLELMITSTLEPDVQKKVFQVNNAELQSKLPIAPQSSIDIKVHLYAEAEFVCPPTTQHITSAHSNSRITGPVAQNDYGPLPSSLTHYSNVSSSGHASLPSRVSSPHHRVSSQHQRRNDTNNASFRSVTSAHTNIGTGVGIGHQSFASLNIHSDAGPSSIVSQYSQNIEAQFRLKYSGGDAMSAGYCRQCAISVNLELLSSAQITNWDVLPAEIPSQFYLVLDISNLTAQEMSLNYTENKNILIEAKESCRVPIPVDRCSLEQVCAAREAEIAENMEKELCFRTEVLSFADSVSKLCAQHIAKHVKLSWQLTGTDINGIASLQGIVLPPSMIDLTTVSPLQWSVLFQNVHVQPHMEMLCVAGQAANLSITICNQSLQPLRNLLITIKFYQDYLNGMENYNLETRVAISGTNRVFIPLLQRNARVHHECSVIFFTPGRFKTSIQCQSKPQSAIGFNAQLSRSCPVPDTYCQLDAVEMQIGNLNMIETGVINYHEQQEHIWKFIPPIEVTVVEQQ